MNVERIRTFFSSENRRLHLCVIVAASIGVFFRVLENGFVWDDVDYLVNKNVYRRFDIVSIFTSPANNFEYLPIRDLTNSMDFLIWGESPWGHHLTSLFIHILAALLVYLLSENLLAGDEHSDPSSSIVIIPLMAGLLFALHPLQAQSVSWVGGRNVLLAGMFSFLALYLFLKYLSSDNRSFYVWGVIAFLCAVLSKATAIVLPLLLTLASFHRPTGKSLKNQMYALLPFWVLSGIFYFVHTKVAFSNGVVFTAEDVTLASRIAVSLQIPWFYIVKFIYPVNLSPEYDIKFVQRIVSTEVIISAAGLILLVTAAFRLRRKDPLCFFGVAWFFLSLVPVLKIFTTSTIVADRYSYIPLLGLTLAVTSLSVKNLIKKHFTLLIFSMFLMCSVLGVLSYRESLVWQSDEKLFQRGIQSSPTNSKHYSNLGLYYFARKDYSKAFPLLDTARNLGEAEDKFEFCMAILHMERGEYKDAINALNRALHKNEEYDLALLKLAEIYGRLGEYENAYVNCMKVLAIKGQVEWETRERAEKDRKIYLAKIAPVLYEMRRQVAASPDDVRLRGEMALKLDRLLFHEEALKEYRELERIGMKGWELQYNIGNVLMKLKRFSEAEKAFQVTISLNPNNKDAFNNYGIALKELKDYRNAIAAFNQALVIDPQFSKAKFNKLSAYYRMGDRKEAGRLAHELVAVFPEMKHRVAMVIEP